MEHSLLPSGTQVQHPRYGIGVITGTVTSKERYVTYTYYIVEFETSGTHHINVRDTRALTAVLLTPPPERQRAP